jgi:hypothetical protein
MHWPRRRFGKLCHSRAGHSCILHPNHPNRHDIISTYPESIRAGGVVVA